MNENIEEVLDEYEENSRIVNNYNKCKEKLQGLLNQVRCQTTADEVKQAYIEFIDARQNYENKFGTRPRDAITLW